MAVMFLPPAMSSSENAPPPAEKPKGPEHTELKQLKIEEEYFFRYDSPIFGHLKMGIFCL